MLSHIFSNTFLLSICKSPYLSGTRSTRLWCLPSTITTDSPLQINRVCILLSSFKKRFKIGYSIKLPWTKICIFQCLLCLPPWRKCKLWQHEIAAVRKESSQEKRFTFKREQSVIISRVFLVEKRWYSCSHYFSSTQAVKGSWQETLRHSIKRN